ncbi:PREDICTED: ewing's tumor-associated antigen 1 isoform X1 [Gavialis gangeticus]|uniref:ewing's tumor-associated antigen 1 isoform X1 n=1 Tax=Gavialis gangeticus TaxID=94835 RepID=UPI00092ED528|nr:PREDICTED: ewing's tumor-associated antigen 1 isoform X1 [Gavialis gangeticus]
MYIHTEPCLYKTPKRSLNNRSRLPTFSSPVNDTDIQHEIFWDPHSPIAHQLGNERKKCATRRCTVEISDIVNRIAPRDEKPASYEGSLLGTWIGENAIPCTPAVARTALNGTRVLKRKNSEEELMKLAEEFDKNLVELDAVQDQEVHCHDFLQTTSEAEALHNSKDDVQIKNLQSFLNEVPEADATLSLKPVRESTGIPVTEHFHTSSQKPVDLEAELALRALFDCSTQKCSGQLSQGLSGISLNNCSDEKKSTLEEEKCISQEMTQTKGHVGEEKCQKQNSTTTLGNGNRIAAPETNIYLLPKQNIASAKTESVASSKPAQIVHDDFDEWDTDLLADDSFVMQITQNPELLSTENASPTTKTCTDSFNGIGQAKYKPNSSHSVAGISAESSSSQYVPLKRYSETIQDTTNSFPFQEPSNGTENTKLQKGSLYGKQDVKGDGINYAGKGAPNRGSDHIPISVQSGVNAKESIQSKSGFTTYFPVKGSSSVFVHSNPHRAQTGKYGNKTHNIFHQSSNVSTNTKPNDLVKVVSQASTGQLNQAELPKKCSVSFDDWNEPKFSDEVLDMFCESESLWNTNCEDDELLYQVCDDVEKQTQSQHIKQGNERDKITQGTNINSRSSADKSFIASKQGLSDHPLAERINIKKETISLNTSHTNSSKVTDRLTTVGNVNCRDLSNVIASVTDIPTLPKYTHFQTYKQTASGTNNVPGKWHRSNSVPVGGCDSEICPISTLNTRITAFNSKVLHSQGLPHNTGNIQNNSCINKMSNKMSVVPSKFTFKKINTSQAAVHVDPKTIEGSSGIRVPQHGLEDSKNQLNVPFRGKMEINQKPPFKRQVSVTFAQSTTGMFLLLKYFLKIKLPKETLYSDVQMLLRCCLLVIVFIPFRLGMMTLFQNYQAC